MLAYKSTRHFCSLSLMVKSQNIRQVFKYNPHSSRFLLCQCLTTSEAHFLETSVHAPHRHLSYLLSCDHSRLLKREKNKKIIYDILICLWGHQDLLKYKKFLQERNKMSKHNPTFKPFPDKWDMETITEHVIVHYRWVFVMFLLPLSLCYDIYMALRLERQYKLSVLNSTRMSFQPSSTVV